MGMHHGFLVAECSWAALRAALESASGPFSQLDRDAKPLNGAIHAAESDGVAYLLEESPILSADPDLAVRLSAELGCRVVGMGAETISGTVWFTAAEAGDARRVYLDISATLTRPFEHGDPLSGEGSITWRDPDGAGLHAALAAFGMPPEPLDRLWETGTRFAPSYGRQAASGAFSRALNEHVRRFEIPNADDWARNIKVVARDGGFDLVAVPSKRSRVFRWLRKAFSRG